MPGQPAFSGLHDAMRKKVTRRARFPAESEAQAPLMVWMAPPAASRCAKVGL